jgi:hypothetical protein
VQGAVLLVLERHQRIALDGADLPGAARSMILRRWAALLRRGP